MQSRYYPTDLDARARNRAKHRTCSALAFAFGHVRDRQRIRYRRRVSGRLFLSGTRPRFRERANRQRRSVRGTRGRGKLDLGVGDSAVHRGIHVRRGCRASAKSPPAKTHLPRYADLPGSGTAGPAGASVFRHVRARFMGRVADRLFCSPAKHQLFQHRSMGIQQRHDHQQPPQRRIRLGATCDGRKRPQTLGRGYRGLGDFAVLCGRRAAGRCLHAALAGVPVASCCGVGGCRDVIDDA